MSSRGKKPEALQQQAILEWFVAEGVLAYRINTGAKKIKGRFVSFGVTGFSDSEAVLCFTGAAHRWHALPAGPQRGRHGSVASKALHR